MSQGQTQFVALPNEVVYCIFDYLTAHDILQAFTQINHRLDNLVRFYIKRIDLTNDWQGSRQELQWICHSIEMLKVNQHYVHLLNDSDDQQGAGFSRPKRTSLLTSFSVRLFTCSKERPQHPTPRRLPHLHSLHLVNIPDWNHLIPDMNLKTLQLWFDDDRHEEKAVIPRSITRFTANIALNSDAFHMNLTVLTITVRSMAHLLEIVDRTPHLHYLSVTLSSNFNRFTKLATSNRPLQNLHYLSFSTKYTDDFQANDRLPLDQIEHFIQECCPNALVLRRLTITFEYILFNESIWSAIIQYQNTFDRFDLYASFIVKDEITKNRMISSLNEHFDYHIEHADPLEEQTRFIHIYSRPFCFDRLHGFISCSELSSRCSYTTVRHLYLTKTPLARPISFESMGACMPHLVSVHCNLSFVHGRQINSSPMIFNLDSFQHVRYLHFRVQCLSSACLCHALLPQLIDRMPRLERLTTSDDTFTDAWHPLPPIKRLSLQQCDFRSLFSLAQHVPHLSALSFPYMTSSVKEFAHLLGSLYLDIPSLKFVSINIRGGAGLTQISFEALLKNMLVKVKNMDERLRHLTLACQYGSAEFALRLS